MANFAISIIFGYAAYPDLHSVAYKRHKLVTSGLGGNAQQLYALISAFLIILLHSRQPI